MNLENLTLEERKELMAQLAEEQKKAHAAKREREKDYKDLVDQTVTEVFEKVERVSEALAVAKKNIYDTFATVLDLKSEIYPKTNSNDSHSFTSSNGQFRITLGNNMMDNYDDTANNGVEMVKAYIRSQANDEKTQRLVNAVLRLLAKDQSGTLKASRVMQLDKLATESGDVDFIEGVRIIKEAYNPIPTKQYVRAQRKGEHGEWVNVPLGMTEA